MNVVTITPNGHILTTSSKAHVDIFHASLTRWLVLFAELIRLCRDTTKGCSNPRERGSDNVSIYVRDRASRPLSFVGRLHIAGFVVFLVFGLRDEREPFTCVWILRRARAPNDDDMVSKRSWRPRNKTPRTQMFCRVLRDQSERTSNEASKPNPPPRNAPKPSTIWQSPKPHPSANL